MLLARRAIEGGRPQQKKALLKTLIAEIRVEGNEGAPLYRFPRAGVRIVRTLVGLSFRNANQPEVTGRPIALWLDVPARLTPPAPTSVRVFRNLECLIG
jgi:hypothetical protein